jgi:hypothetical protein
MPAEVAFSMDMMTCTATVSGGAGRTQRSDLGALRVDGGEEATQCELALQLLGALRAGLRDGCEGAEGHCQHAQRLAR